MNTLVNAISALQTLHYVETRIRKGSRGKNIGYVIWKNYGQSVASARHESIRVLKRCYSYCIE